MPVLEKTNQLLCLHHSVKLEHPSYHGNTLSQTFLDSLPSKIYGDMNRELSFRQGLASSLTTLQRLLGKDKVRCTFILPHYHTADLEVHLDVDGRPVQIDGVSDQSTKPDVHKRIAIEVTGQNQYAVDSEMLLGNPRSKLRQLNKLGYITHVISATDAKKLDTMDSPSREEYLRSILRTELKAKL
ncbi:FAST kinase domain-containing protein 5, mitochondrial-like [Liolophura sinensis]|uniref:FAST kinase domain-containing protein 5, mitochondrial-like n=1 Tax=Liolophura sinensis TaxID=3198878 RepID=UPI0031596975